MNSFDRGTVGGAVGVVICIMFMGVFLLYFIPESMSNREAWGITLLLFGGMIAIIMMTIGVAKQWGK